MWTWVYEDVNESPPVVVRAGDVDEPIVFQSLGGCIAHLVAALETLDSGWTFPSELLLVLGKRHEVQLPELDVEVRLLRVTVLS